MKQKNIRINYFFNTAYQIIAIIVPLITAPYLARTLGASGVGVFSYTNSMVSYFTIIAVLGSATFGQKKIAEIRDKKEALTDEFWNIVAFRLIMTIGVLIPYILFIYLNSNYTNIYIILGISIIDVFLNITWFFQGIEEFPKVVIRNLIARLVSCVCIFCFVKSPSDLPLYVLLVVGSSAIANAWTWLFVRKYIGKMKSVHPFKNIKEMFLLFLPTVAIQVYLVLDKSMIGIITNSSYQNGCYEYSEKIARLALTIVTSVASVILPRVANLYNNGYKEKACSYIYKGYKFVWLLAIPIMFGLIGTAKIFVPVFFGKGFEMSEILIPIFSLLVLFVSLSYVTGFAFLIPIGKQNVYTAIVSISAIFNLITNAILIPAFGAIGASIASVLAELLGILLQLAYCFKKGLLSGKFVFQSSLKYFSCGLIMLLLLILLSESVSTTPLGLLIMIATGAVTYFALLVLFRDSFFKENLSIVFRFFRKKKINIY